MKALLLALLLGVSLHAQSLSFYFDPSDGMAPVSSLQPLPSTYSFPDTSVGQTASVLVRLVNASSAVVTVNALYVGAAAGSSAANNNFSLTGFPVSPILVPGAWEEFYLNFSPTAAGPASAYLQMSIAGQSPVAVSTLSGNGLSSVSLTCIDSNLSLCDGITPIPSNSSLTFGAATGVALGSSYSIPFTLTNNTSTAIPTPGVANATDTPQAFTSTRLASLPPTIAPGSTVDFNIVFTPQALTTASSSAQTASLTVGSASYTLAGYALGQTQGPSFYIDTTDGAAPVSQLKALPSTLTFPNTAVGQMSTVTARVVNPSTTTLQINALYVGAAAGSSVADSNFSITGLENATLAPQGAKEFQINFTPATAGAASGYLQVSVINSAGEATSTPVSTLSGIGGASSVSLTCVDPVLTLCDGKTSIPANSALTFGGTAGVALGSTYSIPFTLTNSTAAAIPAPTISNELYGIATFTSPDLAALPANIAPGSTVTFTLVFTPQPTPGPSTPETSTLTVGSASYTLQGTVFISASGNRPPDTTYVYGNTGKPCQNCSAYTINVGPLPDTETVLFTVANSEILGTVDADITLPALPALSGTGFTLSNPMLGRSDGSSPAAAVPAGQPITIQPAFTLTFLVTFSGAAASTGTLNIAYTSGPPPDALTGNVTYTLNAQPAPPVGATGSDLPGVALMCGASACSSQTFSNQQQVQATLQVGTATTAGATLAISFTSLVTGVTDPAVTFIAPVTQSNLNFLFTTASLSGMLSNGQPGFTFQTGTTAGTINFTLEDQATLQTISLPAITIQPSKVQIESSTAVRSSPNLIVTITGYDNTYSAGPLSFTFYDVSGTNITPNAIQVDATSAFQQYFFSPSNTAGGAFSLQVTFPVTGDVTQIGSVTANITNSAGQASVTQTFQ